MSNDGLVKKPETTSVGCKDDSELNKFDKERRFGWLSWVFVVAGLGWIAFLLFSDSNLVLGQLLPSFNVWFFIALFFGSISVFLMVFVFFAVIMVYAPNKIDFSFAARMLFVSQIVRVLPGRFWGVVYQVNESRRVMSPLKILRVNLDYTVLSLIFNIGMPLVLFLYYRYDVYVSAMFLLAGFILVAFLLRKNWIGLLLNLINSMLPGKLSSRFKATGPVLQYSRKLIFLILTVYMISWGCYLLAWQQFDKFMPIDLGGNIYILCAGYALAWVLGFLTIIVPAGLGVREGAFVVLLGGLINPSVIAYLAVFVRIWLLLIDLLLFVVVFVSGIIGRKYGG